VFRFKLATRGRAGHASMPGIGDNALLRMVRLLSRLDGRQPPFDPYPAGVACLEALTGVAVEDVSATLAHLREAEPRLADQFESMMRVTLAPTMIRASEKENVIPSRCTVRVDCRVPPGMGGQHVRRRVEELLGSEGEGGYSLEFSEEVVGNSSSTETDLVGHLREYVRSADPGAQLLPLVLTGFTDSHWFRKAFPECVAYGFFPQRAMSRWDTTPLIHAPDERIAVDDIEFASRFFKVLAPAVLR
jgi:acetylornithine deacetylase/succinyl-diaminopimelate desuccinylase-like protein